MSTITTVQAVIDALGGEEAVSALTGAKRNAIRMWRYARRLPSNRYNHMTAELAKLGLNASPELWGQIGQSSEHQ